MWDIILRDRCKPPQQWDSIQIWTFNVTPANFMSESNMSASHATFRPVLIKKSWKHWQATSGNSAGSMHPANRWFCYRVTSLTGNRTQRDILTEWRRRRLPTYWAAWWDRRHTRQCIQDTIPRESSTLVDDQRDATAATTGDHPRRQQTVIHTDRLHTQTHICTLYLLMHTALCCQSVCTVLWVLLAWYSGPHMNRLVSLMSRAAVNVDKMTTERPVAILSVITLQFNDLWQTESDIFIVQTDSKKVNK